MKMSIERFVNEIFLRFPPEEASDLDFNKKKKEYVVAITTNDETYDYEETLRDLIRNYEYKCTPAPFHIRQYLKRHIIAKTKQEFVKFNNIYADKGGYTYEFGYKENQKEESIKALKLEGFTNIRFTRELQKNLKEEGEKTWVH